MEYLERGLTLDYDETGANLTEVGFAPGAPPSLGALPHLNQLRCLAFDDVEGGGGGGAPSNLVAEVPTFGDEVDGAGKGGNAGADPIDRQPGFNVKVWMARALYTSQLADVLNIIGLLMLPFSFLIAVAHLIARSAVTGLYVMVLLELNKLAALPAVVYNDKESAAVKKGKILVVVGLGLNGFGIAVAALQVFGPHFLLDLWALPYLAWVMSAVCIMFYFVGAGCILSVAALNLYFILITLAFLLLVLVFTIVMMFLWFVCGMWLTLWTFANPIWVVLIGMAIIISTVLCIYNSIIHGYTIAVFKMISDLPYLTTTVFDESYLLRAGPRSTIPQPPDSKNDDVETLKGETTVNMPTPKVMD